MSRHWRISTRMTPGSVGTPRLGCPFTGACGGSIRSGVGSTRHVAGGCGVRASLIVGGGPGQSSPGEVAVGDGEAGANGGATLSRSASAAVATAIATTPATMVMRTGRLKIESRALVDQRRNAEEHIVSRRSQNLAVSASIASPQTYRVSKGPTTALFDVRDLCSIPCPGRLPGRKWEQRVFP